MWDLLHMQKQNTGNASTEFRKGEACYCQAFKCDTEDRLYYINDVYYKP